ncbi:universal stress protein [Paractinoplanes hotanensis]|uniref:Universal stress protein n=1 Tax=Paractinoplanes hotanensis TaxID=2906497 RepID=A0ABT0YI61_9ACTN|nr:universal stress protein [Actinoplanes hotanensis]MCM4085172.1 universal stress protein [Actinoplanes hotanensis]
MSTATLPRREAMVPQPVLVAVDDDDNAGSLLRRGREEADRLGVPLRATHIWSHCRPPNCSHHRRCHRDLSEASRLLNTLLDENLADAGPPVERDVLHDDDPARALIELSAKASLLVIGASSDNRAPAGALGETCRALMRDARCPLAVVRNRRLSVTRTGW